MDLLYSRYSNPIEFMNLYINQGRFGEFVESVFNFKKEREKEEAEKDEENKLWLMYIHSATDKSFIAWKNEILHQSQSTDVSANKPQKSPGLSMTDEEVENQLNNARAILKGFNMK